MIQATKILLNKSLEVITLNKRYEQMNTQEKIRHDNGGNQLLDPNSASRKCFLLWLDGSYDRAKTSPIYLGEDDHDRLKRRVKELAVFVKPRTNDSGEVAYHAMSKGNIRSLRALTIQEFVDFTAHEYNCSKSHAQKTLVNCVTDIDKVNRELMIDMLMQFYIDDNKEE